VLERVTAWATLTVFKGELNVSVIGEAVNAGARPVPLSATDVKGTPKSEELMRSIAL